MRIKIYFALTLTIAAFSFIKSNAQSSNRTLSNLTSPTAVNQSLLPDTDKSKDLGSKTLGWRDVYLSRRLYLNGKLTMHASGIENFFAGRDAGNTSVSGYNNTGVGTNALNSLTAGGYNTASGYGSLYFNTTGYSNTAFGAVSLYNNTTGYDNTATGYLSLNTNNTGSYNTGSGSWALYSNTKGNNNTAYGYSALWQNNSGNDNTAIGKYVMYNNTTGYSNVAIGTGALYKNKDNSHLVAIGDSALYNFDGASSYDYDAAHTAVGSKALYMNTTGKVNTAFGTDALRDNTTGSYNTATGRGALYGNQSGSYNTAIGYNSFLWPQSSSFNTAIGAYAGGITMFHEVTNSTSIGYYAEAYQSNQVRIGNENVTSIGGQVGWTIFSDGRYKKDVKENVAGLAFINSLRPVTYKVDTKRLNEYLHRGANERGEKRDEKEKAAFDKAAEEASKVIYNGFVAQEVEEAAKKLGFGFSGVDKPQNKDGLYGLRYDNFVVPLVKAVQELSKQNDSLNLKIKEFENLKIENNELKTRLTLIEQKLGIASLKEFSTAVTLTGAGLEQNIPNPFSNTTTIRYTLPEKFATAQIVITDMNGKTLKQVNLSNSSPTGGSWKGAGKGFVNIDASTLSAGTYNYSLVVDGKLVATKQMVLTR